MIAPMAQSAERLVGRDADLETLAGLVGLDGTVQPGGRRHVLLAGDAGVGKTRILRELRGRAAADGRQVLVGHCLDFGDSAEAYLPFTEILDNITTALPDVVAQVADVHPALLRMAPVARALGGADTAVQEALDRGNLFAAIHSLLERAAEKAPLLVVVEDTHWADQSTRDLLTYLFTRPYVGPVAMVASYRADDIHRRHPLDDVGQVRDDAVEDLRERHVRHGALAEVDAVSGVHLPAVGDGAVAQRGEQARLADAGVTGEEDVLAPGLGGRGDSEQPGEGAQLRVATYE